MRGGSRRCRGRCCLSRHDEWLGRGLPMKALLQQRMHQTRRRKQIIDEG